MQPGRALPFAGPHALAGAFRLLQPLARRADLARKVGQPLRLRNQHLVGHLPHFFGVAHSAYQRVVQHRLFEQGHVAAYRRFHAHLLHAGRGRTGRRARHRQVTDHRHVNAGAVHVAGDLNNAAIGQIGDVAAVGHVEMPAVGAPSFQRLDDKRAVLLAAFISRKIQRGLCQPLRELGLKPVAALGANTQIAARLAVDPGRQVDPLVDFFGALAVPGQVFAQVAV